MGYGVEALSVAGSLGAVVLLTALAARLLALGADEAAAREALRRGLTAGVAILAAAFAFERLYYVMARLLYREGADLWSAHPVPAAMSAVACLGVAAALVPLAAERRGRRLSVWGLPVEVPAVALFCVLVAAVLW
jgi:hypothetical protein